MGSSPILSANMVVLAQLVRASACGAEGHRFEPDIPPKYIVSQMTGMSLRVRAPSFTQIHGCSSAAEWRSPKPKVGISKFPIRAKILEMKKEFDML